MKGIIKKLNNDIISIESTTMENGKLIQRYWNDKTINNILKRCK